MKKTFLLFLIIDNIKKLCIYAQVFSVKPKLLMKKMIYKEEIIMQQYIPYTKSKYIISIV